MAYRKVKKGQRISKSLSAGLINALIDLEARLRGFKPTTTEKPSPIGNRGGIVQALNADAMGFSQFSIVGLDDILFSPDDNLAEFKNNFAFRMKTPATAHGHKVGVLQEPCAAGKLGAVMVSGPTVCALLVRDESHTLARPINGDSTQLETTTDAGFPILYKSPGTGPGIGAIVLLDRTTPPSIQVKAGTTCTNEDNPTYPAPPANTFVVRLDSWAFAETPGDETAFQTEGTEFVVAQTYNGQYCHEDAFVLVAELTHANGTKQSWIFEAQHEYKAVAYEDIAADDSGEVALWIDGADTGVRIVAWNDWGDATPVTEDTKCRIRWFQDQRKWVILRIPTVAVIPCTLRNPAYRYSTGSTLKLSHDVSVYFQNKIGDLTTNNVTQLATTTLYDPFMEITEDGLYEFSWAWSIFMSVAPVASSDAAAATAFDGNYVTGVTSGHTHTYQHMLTSGNPHAFISCPFQQKPAVGGAWAGAGNTTDSKTHVYYEMSGSYPTLRYMQTGRTWLQNVDANTQFRAYWTLLAPDTLWAMQFTLQSANLVIHRVGDKTAD